MRQFTINCAGCHADIPFKHPAVTHTEQLIRVSINCPYCDTEITPDLSEPIIVQTKRVTHESNVLPFKKL